MNSDLISRSELKKAFEKVYPLSTNEMGVVVNKRIYDIIDNAPSVYDNPYSDGREDGYIEGYEEAKRECERPTGEWIPVNERLPEVYKKVLVSDVFGVYIGEFIDAEENWGGKHFINEHGMQSKSVVAWQPLPEPYQKGGAE